MLTTLTPAGNGYNLISWHISKDPHLTIYDIDHLVSRFEHKGWFCVTLFENMADHREDAL